MTYFVLNLIVGNGKSIHRGDAIVIEMDYVRILRDLREDADKTQTQIAEILGTSQTMYARYERGANELPIHHLITLSQYYNVSTDYLLGLSKNK